MTNTTAPQTAESVAVPRLKNRNVVAYSLGDIANNMTFMMTSMFLMVYMTDIAGLSAGVAGAIYGITKIWAGVSDLIAGQTVDRVNTKWGRLRPWLLWISTPLAIVFVLLFSTPEMSMTLKIAWIFLFDAAYQLAYSFINIPYGSLSAAMTQDPVDRSKLSGARSIASSVTGVLLSAVVAPQFQDTSGDNIRLQFTITTLILAVIAVILYLLCFAGTRENVPRSAGKISFKATFQMLRQNKPLLILCLGAFFLLTAMFTMNAVGMYYARDVLGNAGYYTFLMLAQTVGTILVASLVPSITIRIGKRNGYIMSVGLAIIGYLVIFFLPPGTLVGALVAWFFLGAGTGGSNALMFSMQADTVDYGEWKSGIRSEGGSYSILSFIRKVGQGVGGWAGGAVVAAFGYVGGAAMQSAEAVQGIRVATGLVPAIVAVFAAAVMFFYRLDSEEHAKVISDLNRRRTQEAIAEGKSVDSQAVMADNVGDGRNTLLRKAGEANPPVITLFGQRGSGATDIGPMVAEMLRVPYYDQKFSSSTLAQVNRADLISDSGFERWLRSVSLGGTQDSDYAAGYEMQDNRKIANQNTEDLLRDADGGGVILGRNGALVLGQIVGTLHVRLVAPINMRAERVQAQTGLSASEAIEQCELEDRLRQEMSYKLYQWNPNDDTSYDLVINTASTTYKQVAELIVEMYRSKYPANVPFLTQSGDGPATE